MRIAIVSDTWTQKGHEQDQVQLADIVIAMSSTETCRGGPLCRVIKNRYASTDMAPRGSLSQVLNDLMFVHRDAITKAVLP